MGHSRARDTARAVGAVSSTEFGAVGAGTGPTTRVKHQP